MLRLIPAPLHRAGLRVAHEARKGWLGWRGGTVTGCSVIAHDEGGRVLLVRHHYGTGLWSFPGGGVRAGEDPAAAAIREFSEELACELAGLRALGVQEEPFHGATNLVHVFAALLLGEPRADGREIADARLFAPDDLPSAASASVQARLALLMRSQQA